MTTEARRWDLNIDEVLEDWEVNDAIRELIANALDEQALTNTDDPEIYQDKQGRWHIRDYGRGLQSSDLKQDENEEKLQNPDQVIGKFGVGLKDALATLYRNNIDVTIHSTHHTYTLEKSAKRDFEEEDTLYVVVQPPENYLEGTDVVIDGCTEREVEAAKSNFIHYSDDHLLEETRFGNVYASPNSQPSSVYVTGLEVATESDFLFSYDITNTTKTVRKALNRERSNVNRSAYTARIKRILKACESETIANRLVSDLEKYEQGTTHDELSWKTIQTHAAKILNAKEEVLFVTPQEKEERKDEIDRARVDNNRVITVPEDTRQDLGSEKDIEGEEIRDIDVFQKEWRESIDPEWVTEDKLTTDERETWELRHRLLEIAGVADIVDEVRIAEQIHTFDTGWKSQGMWQDGNRRIIIERSALHDNESFIGTFLHEAAHAAGMKEEGSAPQDQTRKFERYLTRLLGRVGEEAT